MAGVTTPEGIIIPAGGDTYDYLGEQRRMAASQRTIVPVANPAAAATIITNMAADGRPVSATNPLITWDDSLKTVITYTGTTYPFGKLDFATYRNTTNAFVSGNFTTAVYDTVVEDSNGLTNAADKSKITIKKAGRYMITAGHGFPSGAGRVAMKCKINGVDVPYGGQMVPSAVEGGPKLTIFKDLAVGDYVQMQVFQDTGSSQNGQNSSPYGAPHMSVQQLSFG
jgi:hypothetical protein